MYRDGATLVTSPTDLTKFLACPHLTALDVAVADGRQKPPSGGPDEALELLFRKGLEHEERYLDRLRAEHDVVSIEPRPVDEAARRTEQAMRSGAEVIYQATFLHDGHRGHADFLLRADRPSGLGGWSYDIADTKLARRLKVPALLQMAEYGEHLCRIQQAPPTWLTVVAGDGVQHAYRYADAESYYRRLARRFARFVAEPTPTLAWPVAHCEQCRWQAQCAIGWRRADHLSLVAFMRGDHLQALESAGITTVAGLAAATEKDLPRSIGRASRDRLAQQARLQVAERTTGRPQYELLAATGGVGLLRLPEPDPGDLYLDFEGDPFVEPYGREYLAGIGDRQGGFEALWAHSADEERQLTEQLVDRLLAHWLAHPGMHVYHYAPYEKSALQRLTSRHGVREAELDVLLRAEVLVDLYAVVRQGLRISKESYSIKKLEAFYWGHTRDQSDVDDAMSSVLAYEQWQVAPDLEILERIRSYNQDDVRSTAALHEWLEQRRDELEAREGAELPRPTPDKTADQAIAGDAERAEVELAQRLLDDGHPLLAGLVGWHRRELRPAYWELFRLADLDDEDIVEDGTALGGLGEPQLVDTEKRSNIYRYRFPPQDTAVRVGDEPLDADTHKRVGTVRAIDPEDGWIELKLSARTSVPQPRAIGPRGPVNDAVLRDAIADVGRSALAGQHCLGLRLLRREVPIGLPVGADEAPTAAVSRIGAALGGRVLAVQGPPGTGKSTAGAALISSLLDAGLRVGVTALSHQVVGTLLHKVGRPALHKCDEHQHCGGAQVAWTTDNAAVADALASGEHRLVGGTAWLWSRPELIGAVDVLVIDEAGQFSLANAVAVSRAAESMVLLGDPQQLSQPTQAQHPHGAGVSALEHLLEGHPTVPPDRGVFLDSTWRMHPEITRFISLISYEQRLLANPGLERQAIGGASDSPFHGSGLRWLPVEHQGNESASDEEAGVVAKVVAELVNTPWIDAEGVERPLRPDDVLVVAPYNAHVARLRAALDDRVMVGTVDKFQGREAAVVIYSLASSSVEDAPRGVDFLFDLHRLNVAVSRARALTILVGSPRLLDAPVHSPHQLVLVNALCRFAETATYAA